MASGAPVVLAGDYNVIPTPQDIYPTRSWDNNALIQPESRQAFARLLAQGWTDAMRKLHPDGPLWTFWDYKFERWQKTKACDSITFCFRRICRSGSWTAVLIDGHVGRKMRATMLQHGSCLIFRGSQASPFAVSAVPLCPSISFLRLTREKDHEVRCICCHTRMMFIYLDLRDSWSPLLSPLRLPVPPSRLWRAF